MDLLVSPLPFNSKSVHARLPIDIRSQLLHAPSPLALFNLVPTYLEANAPLQRIY